MGLVIVYFVSSTFALAGFVKGVVGVGLPTIGMGLLAAVRPRAKDAALLVVRSFVTNVWQALGPQLTPLLRRTWPMLLGICAGPLGVRAWGGAGLLTADDATYASI